MRGMRGYVGYKTYEEYKGYEGYLMSSFFSIHNLIIRQLLLEF